MARIRTIKPEFWQDELVASWPPMTRLAYIGLWNEADDDGRMRGNLSYLMSRVFPYDYGSDPVEVFQPILNSGRMVPYEVDGQRYTYLPNFKKHQSINKPQRSKLPGPQPLPEDYGSIPVLLPGGKEQGTGKGNNTPLTPQGENSAFCVWEDSFDKFKQSYPPVPKGRLLWSKAKPKWIALKKNKSLTPEMVLSALEAAKADHDRQTNGDWLVFKGPVPWLNQCGWEPFIGDNQTQTLNATERLRLQFLGISE